jgi:hypothetical protein
VEFAAQGEVEYFPEYEGEEDEAQAEGASDTARKPAKRSKKAEKKRELVFDETLGAVVAKKKRKPTRGGWGDLEDY